MEVLVVKKGFAIVDGKKKKAWKLSCENEIYNRMCFSRKNAKAYMKMFISIKKKERKIQEIDSKEIFQDIEL